MKIRGWMPSDRRTLIARRRGPSGSHGGSCKSPTAPKDRQKAVPRHSVPWSPSRAPASCKPCLRCLTEWHQSPSLTENQH